MTEFRTVRVAAVQATPVILDAAATIDKAVSLIGEAAGEGAELVVLPETFVPLYPSGVWAKEAASFEGFDEFWEQAPRGRRPEDACRGGRPGGDRDPGPGFQRDGQLPGTGCP